jgi:hypothetical protein
VSEKATVCVKCGRPIAASNPKRPTLGLFVGVVLGSLNLLWTDPSMLAHDPSLDLLNPVVRLIIHAAIVSLLVGNIALIAACATALVGHPGGVRVARNTCGWLLLWSLILTTTVGVQMSSIPDPTTRGREIAGAVGLALGAVVQFTLVFWLLRQRAPVAPRVERPQTVFRTLLWVALLIGALFGGITLVVDVAQLVRAWFAVR